MRDPKHVSPDAMIDAVLDRTVTEAILAHVPLGRRQVLASLGRGALLGAVASVFPLAACKEAVKETVSDKKTALEKKQLKIGFVPITCATPIIMAHPLGFYARYGLEVEVLKTAGWAVARDKSLSKEYDASHMLSPMPLAMTLGAGSVAAPFYMAAVENLNGQAITLHIKHKDKRDPKTWAGFKFAVPFDYSMHNLLLRYYVAEHGLDPDKDIQIRVLDVERPERTHRAVRGDRPAATAGARTHDSRSGVLRTADSHTRLLV